ncbi:MAG: type II secretion system F family protein, partial [Bdellovibrionota bacterium]
MAPIFDYKAFSSSGKSVKGLIEADSQKTARMKLKKQGLMTTEIKERNAAKKNSSGGGGSLFSGGYSVKDISMMTRQIASLIKANIPLVEALNAVVEQTDKEGLKVILSHVRDDVNEGLSLGKATAKHPKAFDNVFVNMIEAGESSGTLGMVLVKLADLKEAQVRLRNKVVSGMTYPALMMVVSGALLVGIFTFVIPKITEIFKSMNRPVPELTQVLIFISATLTDYWPIFLSGGVGGTFFFQRYIKTPNGKAKWDRFKLMTPVFGSLIRMVAITRFASTMSTLLGSGVPILTSMNIARNLVDNVP